MVFILSVGYCDACGGVFFIGVDMKKKKPTLTQRLNFLEKEVEHIKRNVFYDCKYCNYSEGKPISRWHEHEKGK